MCPPASLVLRGGDIGGLGADAGVATDGSELHVPALWVWEILNADGEKWSSSYVSKSPIHH
jgi:hypothetical protein